MRPAYWKTWANVAASAKGSLATKATSATCIAAVIATDTNPPETASVPDAPASICSVPATLPALTVQLNVTVWPGAMSAAAGFVAIEAAGAVPESEATGCTARARLAPGFVTASATLKSSLRGTPGGIVSVAVRAPPDWNV